MLVTVRYFDDRDGNRCVGTDEDDNIEGTKKADRISGKAGDDVIRGFAGGDFILGNLGNDRLFGLNGGDTLKGNPGADRLIGRGGNDKLRAGRDLNPDVISCGSGFDSATVSVGDLVQTEEGDLVAVTLLTVQADLELLTTCEEIRIIILQ